MGVGVGKPGPAPASLRSRPGSQLRPGCGTASCTERLKPRASQPLSTRCQAPWFLPPPAHSIPIFSMHVTASLRRHRTLFTPPPHLRPQVVVGDVPPLEDVDLRIAPEDLQLVALIGKGACGEVYVSRGVR